MEIPLDIPHREETVDILSCARCGSAVIDTELHDRWHVQLESVASAAQVSLLALNRYAPDWLPA